MAKVSPPIIPITLDDGTKIELSMEEAASLRDQLSAVLPPVFVPLKVPLSGVTTDAPTVQEEDVPG